MRDENRGSDWSSEQQPGSVWPSSQPMQPAPPMPTAMSDMGITRIVVVKSPRRPDDSSWPMRERSARQKETAEVAT